MNIIEGVIVNDRFLESIAINLHNEAKDAQDGHRFKKIVPAMAFYCFMLESKLLTYGKAIFIKKSEYVKFINCTLLSKFEWLLKRLNVPEDDIILNSKTKVSEMVAFRNAVTHSKNIDVKEERELTGLELLDDKFIRVFDNENDFMASSTLDKLNDFSEVIWILDQIWFVYGKKHFNDDFNSLLVNHTRVKSVSRN